MNHMLYPTISEEYDDFDEDAYEAEQESKYEQLREQQHEIQ